jgi:hypothetical protein
MLRLKIIACKILFREISLLSAQCTNYLDVTYVRQKLHNTPKKLKNAIQAEIDSIESGKDIHTSYPPNNEDFDAILLGYGLCSNCIEGVKSHKYPLIVPRAHDCITLFLGSKEKYKDYFFNNKGTYWYNKGWIENAPMPGEIHHEALLKEYTLKYGKVAEDMVAHAEDWREGYNTAAFIRWSEIGTPYYEQYTKDCADYIGWDYRVVEGDSSLIKDFLNGNWSDDRFLVVPPNKEILPSYDDNVII